MLVISIITCIIIVTIVMLALSMIVVVVLWIVIITVEWIVIMLIWVKLLTIVIAESIGIIEVIAVVIRMVDLLLWRMKLIIISITVSSSKILIVILERCIETATIRMTTAVGR